MPSASRTKGTTPATARVAPNRWQFVNVGEPKRNQDKEVISIVRAHAMRNVRRKQRLSVTLQHQKRLNTKVPASIHAGSSETYEHSVQMNPHECDRPDSDRPVVVCELPSEFECIHLVCSNSRDEAVFAAEYGKDGQPPADSQSYSKKEMQAPNRLMLGLCTRNPKSLVGDGSFDPFNAMPIDGCARYDSHVLNHCKNLLCSTFLFGLTRPETHFLLTHLLRS